MPLGAIQGSGRNTSTQKFTVDSLTLDNSGQKFPLDSVVESVQNNSITMNFVQLGLTYNIADIRKERFVFSYGLALTYTLITSKYAEIRSYDETSYSPTIYPSTIANLSTEEGYVKFKSQLFGISTPITTMILLNQNRKLTRPIWIKHIGNRLPVYLGLQINPFVRLGNVNNTTMNSFDCYFSIRLIFGFNHFTPIFPRIRGQKSKINITGEE